MPSIRTRQIVRRAVMVLAVVVLIGLVGGWLARQEPPEIQRSRALRLGMTVSEVRAVMGAENGAEVFKVGNNPVLIVHYGRLNYKLKGLRARAGLPTKGLHWPVRVHYGRGATGWRVCRIDRGDEIEEVP